MTRYRIMPEHIYYILHTSTYKRVESLLLLYGKNIIIIRYSSHKISLMFYKIKKLVIWYNNSLHTVSDIEPKTVHLSAVVMYRFTNQLLKRSAVIFTCHFKSYPFLLESVFIMNNLYSVRERLANGTFSKQHVLRTTVR